MWTPSFLLVQWSISLPLPLWLCVKRPMRFIGGSLRVILVVTLGFLSQNFGRWWGPTNDGFVRKWMHLEWCGTSKKDGWIKWETATKFSLWFSVNEPWYVCQVVPVVVTACRGSTSTSYRRWRYWWCCVRSVSPPRPHSTPGAARK